MKPVFLFPYVLFVCLIAWPITVVAGDALSSVKALDGSWVPDTKLVVENNCPAGEFIMETFTVDDGYVTGKMGHSQDGPFRFNTRIDQDGSVDYYSQAQYVMVRGRGQFTDDRGTGSFEVSGETNCSGRWELIREK
jgi:hypothetical protein